MKRLKDSSDVPEAKAWNLAKNMYKLTEKDKATFFFPAEEWVLPLASTKELEEREFVVDSGPSMHTVSKKDLDSAELETNEDIEKSDDGDDGQRRSANKRRSHGICQRIALIRHCHVSSRNSRSAFIGETLRRTWVHVSLENHNSPKNKQEK